MEPQPATAIPQGPGIPVELPEVEDALDRLWGPAAEQAGGPELEHPSVTRVALANVVLVRLGPDRPGLDETIEAITTQYPSRLIVVRPAPDSAGRRIAAEVSAQCHLPAPGRPQVCSEQVVLRAGPSGRDLIPGAVRSLVESDLHSILWWCDEPSTAPGLLGPLAEGATRVILDLPDPEADPSALALAAEHDRCGLARDVAWFGLSPWRSLIAELFDPPASADLARIASVRVLARADRSDRVPRAAAWLVSWLAGQLGWEPIDVTRPAGSGRLEAIFRSPSGPVRARIETEAADVGPRARIAEVELSLRGDGPSLGTLRVVRDGPTTCSVAVRVDDRPAPTCPRFLHAPDYDADRLISAALLTDRTDPPYRRALPIARRLLGV